MDIIHSTVDVKMKSPFFFKKREKNQIFYLNVFSVFECFFVRIKVNPMEEGCLFKEPVRKTETETERGGGEGELRRWVMRSFSGSG